MTTNANTTSQMSPLGKPRISRQTAEVGADLIQAMGKQGVLPRTEALAAAAILREAASVPKDSPRPPGEKARLLTTAQVAERLNASRKTVLRMANDGLLRRRFLRPGNSKSLRFSEAEVSALCEAGFDERR